MKKSISSILNRLRDENLRNFNLERQNNFSSVEKLGFDKLLYVSPNYFKLKQEIKGLNAFFKNGQYYYLAYACDIPKLSKELGWVISTVRVYDTSNAFLSMILSIDLKGLGYNEVDIYPIAKDRGANRFYPINTTRMLSDLSCIVDLGCGICLIKIVYSGVHSKNSLNWFSSKKLVVDTMNNHFTFGHLPSFLRSCAAFVLGKRGMTDMGSRLKEYLPMSYVLIFIYFSFLFRDGVNFVYFILANLFYIFACLYIYKSLVGIHSFIDKSVDDSIKIINLRLYSRTVINKFKNFYKNKGFKYL